MTIPVGHPVRIRTSGALGHVASVSDHHVYVVTSPPDQTGWYTHGSVESVMASPPRGLRQPVKAWHVVALLSVIAAFWIGCTADRPEPEPQTRAQAERDRQWAEIYRSVRRECARVGATESECSEAEGRARRLWRTQP